MNLPCQQSFENLYLAFLIYATFAFLFIRFFIKSYIRTPRKQRIKKDWSKNLFSIDPVAMKQHLRITLLEKKTEDDSTINYIELLLKKSR